MSDATSVNSTRDRRRWLILGVIGTAQLMVVLDLTVMNIPLPSAQRALHFTTPDQQRVAAVRGPAGLLRSDRRHRAWRRFCADVCQLCSARWTVRLRSPAWTDSSADIAAP